MWAILLRVARKNVGVMRTKPRGLLPARHDVEPLTGEPAYLPFEEASEIFAVLSSATARSILERLYRTPAPASDIATDVETSVQNATYHLTRLQRTELVTVVDTWYSSKGLEMKVYSPTKDPLVVIAGSHASKRRVVRNSTHFDTPTRCLPPP